MNVSTLAEEVRESHRAGTRRRIVGAGTWLDAGRPVRPDAVPLPLAELRGITEYVPGDLTLTTLAGTTLAELHEATRANGQRVALDPYGSDAGTIGATVATASAGPYAAAFGTPRDQVLGVTFVTGTGDVVRAGGRVVKNVAGFDLARLTIGAWGTLGVIAEVSLRLRALPAVDETVAVALDTSNDRVVGAAVDALRALPFPFEALELMDGATARSLALSSAPAGVVLARVAGSPDVVRAMRAALSVVGDPTDVDPTAWSRARADEVRGATCIRLSHAPAHALDVWRTARSLAVSLGGTAQMSLGRTVARVSCASGSSPLGLQQRLAGFSGTVVAERLAEAEWQAPVLNRRHTDSIVFRLHRGVRDAFDPGRLLNTGILGAAGGDT